MAHMRSAIRRQIEKDQRTIKKIEEPPQRMNLEEMPYNDAIDQIKSDYESGSPRDISDIRNFIMNSIDNPFIKNDRKSFTNGHPGRDIRSERPYRPNTPQKAPRRDPSRNV